MKGRDGSIVIAVLLLVSFAFMVSPAVAEWHGGKALVMYRTWSPSDGWVQYNYKTSYNWDSFRAELKEQNWSVDYAKHVNTTMLSNYDALFVLTPRENIPDDEARAIINWVLEGGQLVITQNGTGTYANEITGTFGITFDGYRLKMKMTNFSTHPVTTTPFTLTEVRGVTARNISVNGTSQQIGFDKKGRCFLAVNDTAGKGVVVAIGDEYMWSDWMFNCNDNEELLDNILAYFKRTCSVPEFTTLTFTIPVFGLLSVVFLLLRRRR